MMFNQWMLCFKCSILHSDRQNWSWIRDPKFQVNINRYFWRFLTWNLNWQKENSFSSPNSQTANQMAKPNDQETDKKQDHLEMAASEEFFWYLEISLNPTLKLINRHKHVIRNLNLPSELHKNAQSFKWIEPNVVWFDPIESISSKLNPYCI